MPHVDESRIAAQAASTKAADVSNVPTQVLLENWYGPESAETMQQRPEMQYVRRAEAAQWIATKRNNDATVSAKDRARFIAVNPATRTPKVGKVFGIFAIPPVTRAFLSAETAEVVLKPLFEPA